MLALNLGICNELDSWDGHEEIQSDKHHVFHRSFPHHFRNYFIDVQFASYFDYIILVTRDWNCSLKSKILNHTPNYENAIQEHNAGINAIKDLLNNLDVKIFSSETAFLLQDSYTVPFLKLVGIENPIHVEFLNVNEKYLVENNG